MARGIKLDDIYLQMLEELGRDARISNSDLSKRLNISETAVRRRMSVLIDGEYVRPGAITNPAKLGYQLQIWAGISVASGKIRAAVDALNARPEVSYIAIVAGNYDIILGAWFHSVDELQAFLADHLKPIDGILHCDTYLILEVLVGLRGTWRNPNVSPHASTQTLASSKREQEDESPEIDTP